MDPVSVKEMTAFMPMFMALLENMGAEGVLGFLFGGPLMVIAAFWLQGWSDRRHSQKLFEEFRKTIWDLWERHREETDRHKENHRKEIGDIIRKFDESLERTTRYYENNVLLVQNYEKLTNELQSLIVTTIQTLGRVDAHFEGFCKTIYAPKVKP